MRDTLALKDKQPCNIPYVIMPQLLSSAILNKTFYLLFLILFLTAQKSDWIEVKKNIDLIK